MPHIKVNGLTLRYDLRGPSDAPVVAFAHSLGSRLEMWDAAVAALAGRYRCLRYDVRGHGGSEAADRSVRVDDLADDLAGLLDGLDIAVAHVVGLSLGGMAAQAFALRHPARLERLVLMATSAEMPREPWLERAASVRKDGLAPLADVTMSPRWFTRAFADREARTIAAFREHFLATDHASYAACCGAVAELGLRQRIGAIAARTLIMVGADDPSTPPAMAEDMRNRIPEAELVVVPRAAHMLPVERPEIVNPYLAAFLDRSRGASTTRPPTSLSDGLANRKAVLGAAHVERSLAAAGSFAAEWQDFITRVAWGEIWGDPALPWKTRSMLTLAMMIALHREEEFKLHLGPALANGVTVAELKSLIMQSAVYAGVPAANAAFRWSRDALGDRLEE